MTFAPQVIGILRGVESGFFGDLMQASFRQGLQAIEVTMNTPGAAQIVAKYRPLVPANCFLGMGTVRNMDEARAALDAGAMFFVTPNLDPQVVEFAKTNNIPIVAGALTPTEVYAASRAGAGIIKIFPCGAMGGPQYIKDLLGPFDDLKLAAVGGVTIGNLADYFKAGAASVGVSTALFGKEALERKNLTLLTSHVKQFMEMCNSITNSALSSALTI